MQFMPCLFIIKVVYFCVGLLASVKCKSLKIVAATKNFEAVTPRTINYSYTVLVPVTISNGT